MSEADLLIRLEGLVAAFNRHDVEGVLTYFADDAVMELPQGPQPWGSRYAGKDAVRAGVAERFAGLPDVHYAQVEHAVADRLGISRWTLTGSPPHGDPVEFRGCDFYQFDGAGRVIRKDSYRKSRSDGLDR